MKANTLIGGMSGKKTGLYIVYVAGLGLPTRRKYPLYNILYMMFGPT